MASVSAPAVATPPVVAPAIRPKLGRDDRLMLVFLGLLGVYLIVSLALPLAAMLLKSAQVRTYDFDAFEVQIDTGAGFTEITSLAALADTLGLEAGPAQARRSPSLTAAQLFEDGAFEGAPVRAVRIRYAGSASGLLERMGGAVDPGAWAEVDGENLRRLVLRAGTVTSLANYVAYFRTPSLSRSIGNSFAVALATTVITVLLAFWFAYALHRTCMPLKGVFRTIAMVPILVPSLLAGLSLVYLFGNQGLLKGLLLGGSIYGAPGIIVGSIFFTFPHALLIISTALSIADARLFEAARALRATPERTFFTVTLPGAQYGVISAAFVVFTLTITDFGVPKVVGGDFSVLAVDIYKQVVGQQNFAMGAVVSVVLLVPAVIAFVVDRMVTARQVALLSARAVPYQPRPNRRVDRTALIFCCAVAGFLLLIVGISQYAALMQFWPYDHSLSFRHFSFEGVDGGGWASYGNSVRLALYTAVIGTAVVFVGAYLVEKGRGFRAGAQRLSFPRHAAHGHPGHGSGPRLHLLLQQSFEPIPFHLWDHGDPGDLHDHPLLHGIAPDRAHRPQSHGPRVRGGVVVAETAPDQDVHAGDLAGVPADGARHRGLLLRQRHDHRVGGHLYLCAGHDACRRGRTEHGRRRADPARSSDVHGDLLHQRRRAPGPCRADPRDRRQPSLAHELSRHFDLAVVGAGIVGLAHALAAARRGLRVVVDRPRARGDRRVGAQFRLRHRHRPAARRMLAARPALARRLAGGGAAGRHRDRAGGPRSSSRSGPEAIAVLEAFAATEMGAAARSSTARGPSPPSRLGAARRSLAALWSPHELRVESRDAIPQLAAWLEQAHGVAFVRDTLVKDVAPPRLTTTAGTFGAERGRRLPGRRPPHPLPGAHRGRSASTAAGCTCCSVAPARWRVPPAGRGDVRPVARPLSRLRRAARGRSR